MSQALYRKYRSKNFDEVVGQEEIVQALRNSINSKKISHAYLFSGPRGIGKTSIARIFAYNVNEISFNEDYTPVDIIEIDAASNRKIEEIRDLREKARILPVELKYKIYIIDEVHMLTREAFNALLKTLEEPPAHVIFILATTEFDKLPETIVSRTQKYNFKLVTINQVSQHLENISKKEKININRSALDLISQHSEGSLRDALSLLDQVRHLKIDLEITEEDVEESLGVPSNKIINQLLEAIEKKDILAIQELLDSFYSIGITANQLSKSLCKEMIRDITENSIEKNNKLLLIDKLLKINTSMSPEIYLKLVLIEYCMQGSNSSRQPSLNKPAQEIYDTKEKIVNTKKVVKKQEDSSNLASGIEITELEWKRILENIREEYNTIYGILRMATLKFVDNGSKIIHLKFKFKFHQKRITDQKNMQIILDSIENEGFKGYRIETSLDNKIDDTKNSVSDILPNIEIEETTDLVNKIENVFGQAEVI